MKECCGTCKFCNGSECILMGAKIGPVLLATAICGKWQPREEETKK